MKKIVINRAEYIDKVYGCWIGKNIGGTLGTPFEGRREILDVTGYTSPAGSPLPNDDLDLQLVWLKAVIEHGVKNITASLLSEYWIDFIPPPWGEYGIGKMNIRAGLLPPLSGMHNNEILRHSNGAWIRSEIWACLFPAAPDAAIRLAYEDASVDHGSGEGMYAELFTAAVESAAFVISDVRELIRIGLSKIPPDCRVARAVNIAVTAYDAKRTWQEARGLVVADSVPEIGWFQAPANVGFVIIGWLYGEGDFGRSLLIATNCGDDTDCTAATLGAVMGIIRGAKNIPAEWIKPIGDSIVTVAINRGPAQGFWPKTLAELTEKTIAQTPLALAAFGTPVEINDGATDVTALSGMDFAAKATAEKICARSPYAVRVSSPNAVITLDYQRSPVLRAGEPFTVRVDIESVTADHCQFDITWYLPDNIRVLEGKTRTALMLQRWVESGLISRGSGKPHEPFTFTLVADRLDTGTIRGVLEVRAQGRANAGYIPVVFLNEG
ncbi:MAG: ADP-ribosylglycohydrolase family protein [Spirochaetes bacterium]|nr:ADP-ribosylglycohydrolase family protein [Spirochaetota bacterium]